MKFPEHWNEKDINEYTNFAFEPLLKELGEICTKIGNDIDMGLLFHKVPIYGLSGKISALIGVLKGIELMRKSFPTGLE